MTELIGQCSTTNFEGKPPRSYATAFVEERLLFGTRCGRDGEEYSEGDAANLQLASPSLFTWRERLYQKFQDYDNFRTQMLALAWVSDSLQRLSVDILRTPNGREFLLPLCRPNTKKPSQKTLNPAKIQDTSNVIQSNQVQSNTRDSSIKMPREYLTKPSSTMKIKQIEIPDSASIQGSIIPCVKDIDTGEVSTKGYFTVQLKGKALQEFSQNHRIIKFQVEVGLSVNDKDSGNEEVPSSPPDSSASSKKMESFSIRNKKGQLRCLTDLIHHKDLLQITQSTVCIDITYSIIVLVS